MNNTDNYNQHRILYASFVNTATINFVANSFAKRDLDILRAEYANGNKHLNMIASVPLHKWDRFYSGIFAICNNNFAHTGEWRTMATAVCIAKEAMKQYIESLQ